VLTYRHTFSCGVRSFPRLCSWPSAPHHVGTVWTITAHSTSLITTQPHVSGLHRYAALHVAARHLVRDVWTRLITLNPCTEQTAAEGRHIHKGTENCSRNHHRLSTKQWWLDYAHDVANIRSSRSRLCGLKLDQLLTILRLYHLTVTVVGLTTISDCRC